jgi:ragB, susD protein
MGAANVVYSADAAANIGLTVEPTFHDNWTFDIPTQEKNMNPNITQFD